MAERFLNFARTIRDPADYHLSVPGGTAVTFTNANRPRAIRCDASGTLVLVDADGTSVTYNLLQGEVLPIAGAISIGVASTADVICWY